MNMKVKFVLAMLAGFACASAVYFLVLNVGSDSAKKDLESWIEHNKNGYELNVKDSLFTSENNTLSLKWRGMEIKLDFDTLVQNIAWQKDSLQNHLQAYNVYDIYNRLPNNGWEMQPIVNKNINTGLTITKAENEALALEIATDIIAMQAKKEDKACENNTEDTCFIYIQTKLPFQIKTELLKVQNIQPQGETKPSAE